MTIDISYKPSRISRWKECVLLLAETFGLTSETSMLQRRFSECIRSYDAMLRRICLGYSHSPQDLEDLYQDVLVNVWRGLPSFREESSVKTWLYRIALNTCVSTLRLRSKEPAKVSLESVILVPDDSHTKKVAIMDLYESISTLGPVDKAVVMMWLDGYRYEEIADTVGLNRNAVATRIHRAKEKLRSIYNP